MKYCSDCKVLNDENQVYCKICGKKLDEVKPQVKTVTKYKTKVKKQGSSKQNKKEKQKVKKIIIDERQKGLMTFGQKFMMFFLFMLCLVLGAAVAFLSYHIYQTEFILVPSVIGFKKDEAISTLKDSRFNYEIVEVVDDENVGIVLKQSKSSGSRARENSIIKLTVGVADDRIIVPDVTGLDLASAVSVLNKNGINYEVEFEESDMNDVVLSQSIKEAKKINKDEILKIVVAKEVTLKDSNS